MRLFIENIWSATSKGKTLTRRAFFLWQLLKVLSIFYAFILLARRIYLLYKKIPKANISGPVIAVAI
ncbi:hypothetical protein FJ364_01675 [Candidatus Dependentiae bacterium]|nr:hypothetical protein [Candidatus Dependentiae bacterium]